MFDFVVMWGFIFDELDYECVSNHDVYSLNFSSFDILKKKVG